MKDGLKIYACSGFAGVGSKPEEFDYWRDNTNTSTNTCAVNSLLADINLLFTKLQYEEMSEEDIITSLNLIDLYATTLQFACAYHGAELRRAGAIIGSMVDDGMFNFDSWDNNERDANLDSLISYAQNIFMAGEKVTANNDYTTWFEKNIIALDYQGLTAEQQEQARLFAQEYAAKGGVGATDKKDFDPASFLYDAGEYYLYLYMSAKSARRVGGAVSSKRSKEQEVYDYVHKVYDPIYGSAEKVDSIIYSGIIKHFGHTPQYVINKLSNNNYGTKGIGDFGVSEIIAIVTAVISAVVAITEAILNYCAKVAEAKYAVPVDANLGTPGLGEKDLDEWENQQNNKTYLKYGIAAAALVGAVVLLK